MTPVLNSKPRAKKRVLQISLFETINESKTGGLEVKNLKALFAAGLLLSVVSTLPVRASDSVPDMAKNTALFPVKVLAVGTAAAVGTPIAVVRQVAVRIRDFTGTFADKIGGKDSFPPNLFASVLSIPFGTLVGSAEGLYYGPKNAVQHGVEKPFSQDSFSLGSMEE